MLHKVSTTTAPRRDVFIGVTLNGARWTVMSYLTRMSYTDLQLPPTDPDLREPITGV